MIDYQEQFSLIYDQYIDKIYRFVYLKVSSVEIAEDLTSKVFLKCWENYQKGQKLKNPRAFLYQIARNTVIDYYRQKDRTKTVPMEAVSQVPGKEKSPYDKAVLSAEVELIIVAIRKLKEDYQDILIWYYLEDMSAETIAELTDKPVGTVRVMIHRGLEMLKNEMGVL